MTIEGGIGMSESYLKSLGSFLTKLQGVDEVPSMKLVQSQKQLLRFLFEESKKVISITSEDEAQKQISANSKNSKLNIMVGFIETVCSLSKVLASSASEAKSPAMGNLSGHFSQILVEMVNVCGFEESGHLAILKIVLNRIEVK